MEKRNFATEGFEKFNDSDLKNEHSLCAKFTFLAYVGFILSFATIIVSGRVDAAEAVIVISYLLCIILDVLSDYYAMTMSQKKVLFFVDSIRSNKEMGYREVNDIIMSVNHKIRTFNLIIYIGLIFTMMFHIAVFLTAYNL